MKDHSRLNWNTWIIGSLVLGCNLFSGCSSEPIVPPETRAEAVRKHQVIGTELAQQVEPKLKFKKDSEVISYLNQTARELMVGVPELNFKPPQVSVVRNEKGRWQSFALPGNRIYLSVGLLKTLDYEAELAALIAMQLAHLYRGDVVNKIEQEKNKEKLDQQKPIQNSSPVQTKAFKESTDLFEFTDDVFISTSQEAVRILYRAGYDARGIVSLYGKMRENPKSSPFDMELVSKMEETARREISAHTPVRNPIVKSQTFVQIRKRMQRL